MGTLDNSIQRRDEMKKVVIEISVTVCLILFASVIFAAENQEGSSWFKPSLSVGYALSDPNLTFSTKGANLGGVGKIDVRSPSVSGVYVAVELPFALTDRLALTFDGRWIFFSTRKITEDYSGGFTANRVWDTDKRRWGTVNVLLSYSVLKNTGALKDLSPVIGFRWDHHNLGFDNPRATGIVSNAGDTVDFRMNTYAAVLGLKATLAGFRSGNFGGDVRLAAYVSPFLWGNVNYRETFVTTVAFDFNKNKLRGAFVTVTGEADLLSVRIAPGLQAKLSITPQYTWSRIHKTGTMQFLGTGFGAPASADFEFAYRPRLFTVGLKGSVSF
jgi:hypothetical protein